eukprot:172310_1
MIEFIEFPIMSSNISMQIQIILLLLHLLIPNLISDIIDIERVTFQQMIELNKAQSRRRTSILNLKQPLIVTQSPMINWILLDNMQDIFSNNFTFNSKLQQINCSCINNIHPNLNESNLHCNEYISKFTSTSNKQLQNDYWNQYEINYNKYKKYEQCIEYSDKYITHITRLIQQLYNKNQCHIQNNTDTMKKVIDSCFSLININQGDQYQKINAMQLNTLDHISLSPYFKLFHIYDSFRSISAIDLWFGLHQYHTIRHYDTSNNLFFVLYGSRKFRLSAPTINVFPMYPYTHKSCRHQYKYYKEVYMDLDDIDYNIYEGIVYENELLYIPSGWWNEIINDNHSFALSLWYNDGETNDLRKRIIEYELPINPRKDELSLGDLDELFYFTQHLVSLFCGNHTKYDPLLRCNKYNSYLYRNNMYRRYGDYNEQFDGYLLINFKMIYPILNDLNFDTFEWYAIEMDFENIFKCSMSRKIIEYRETMESFKNDFFYCYDVADEWKHEWNVAIDELLDLFLSISNNKMSEDALVQYLENLLFNMFDDVAIIPIIARLLHL